MKINGIKEIAEAAGCSCSTVSRVLNNRNGISEATRQKIISIAERLDYANKRKKRIVAVFCFLDSDGYDAYSMHLLRQVVLALHNAGFYAEVLFNENIEIVGEHYICGAISIQISVEGIPELWGKKYRLPMVCVNDRDNLPEASASTTLVMINPTARVDRSNHSPPPRIAVAKPSARATDSVTNRSGSSVFAVWMVLR